MKSDDSRRGCDRRTPLIAWALLLAESCSSSQPKAPSNAYGNDAGPNAGSPSWSFDAGNALIPNEGGTLLPPVDGSLPVPTLAVTPGSSTLTIDATAPKTIAFNATLNDGSPADNVTWSIDQKALGSIDMNTGVFTPSGAGGTVTILASAASLYASAVIVLQVKSAQEGDPTPPKTAGAGGLGGVGGEGGGTKISDAKLRAALDQSPKDDADLVWLYPYDGTVWPRGLPAPLLQWKHGAHAPLAVKVHLEVDKSSFVYDGYFAPPSALPAGAPFDRVPIPQTIWDDALQSGSKLTVALTIAASDGNGGYVSYAFKKSMAWTIAPASLKGVVYYNSYGTLLAKNSGGAKGGDGRFGGATLAIQAGAFDPILVAGTTTNDNSGCRVCHTVAAGGSVLIAQHDQNTVSSQYDLKNMNKETLYPGGDNGKFAWSALYPDGTIALGNAGPPGNDSSNVASLNTTGLYKVSDGTVLTAQGLPALATQAAMPAFSPDGSKVAFNLNAGPGSATIKADGNSLVVMDVKKIDDTTYDFSNPSAVYTSAGGDQRPGWPFFLPDMSGVVFELQLKAGANSEMFATRNGARGQLWWTDLHNQAHALDNANGSGYVPSGPLNHDDDATLNYEPTVAPIVAGGYAWVVFTSRRLYGNVATRDPFESDPRDFDLTSGNSAGPTTKKLWVTALDVPAKPGTDPSHPAFYLPAQELFAGNSRGFWVLDACREAGKNCDSGDQCCGGYCRSIEEFGLAVCMNTPPSMCAKEYDSCNVSADCCRVGNVALQCIAHRCAEQTLF